MISWEQKVGEIIKWRMVIICWEERKSEKNSFILGEEWKNSFILEQECLYVAMAKKKVTLCTLIFLKILQTGSF